MTENMQIALEAINKWVYFGWNYSTVPHEWTSADGTMRWMALPKFLVEVKWTCNFDHMVEKWKDATRDKNPNTYLLNFYGELDIWNRRQLLQWIVENYQDERKLF